MSSRDRKPRNVPMFPKPSITTPARAALQGRPRSDTGPSNDTTPSASLPSSSSSPDAPRAPSPPTSSPSSNPPSRNPSTKTASASPYDKDDRIAHLEAAAAVMEGSFVHELEHLSDKLAAESEAAAFWQSKFAALHAAHAALAAQVADLRADVEHRQRELEAREARERDAATRISSLLLERDALREGIGAARAVARQREAEAAALRGQVRGLKEFVSTSGRSEGQVTDEAVGERFGALGSALQNWVLRNFRRAKVRVVGEMEELEGLCPMWEGLAGTAKVHLIQSIVAVLLVKRVFGRYFAGLEEERERELRGFEEWLAAASGGAEANQWRAATLGAINKARSLEHLEARTEEIALALVTETMGILEAITDVEPAEQRNAALRALIVEAIALSRMLRVQKASFKLTMAVVEGHQVNTFQDESMEDIGGEDEDTLEGREIVCITFPGIVKEGDEGGQRMQFRNIIAKAKVLC